MTALRIRYQTHEFGDIDIHVATLRDTQEFSDDHHIARDLGISSAMWPIFGVLWAASLTLARRMVDIDIEGRRILEVGCGIGLASLVLNHRGADITATDQHPRAAEFLARNAALNGGPPIPFVRTDWNDTDDGQLGTFDLIVGSDLLYEDEHAGALATFIQTHARPVCEVVLVGPRRGHGGQVRRALEAQGFVCSEEAVEEPGLKGEVFRGQVLGFVRG